MTLIGSEAGGRGGSRWSIMKIEKRESIALRSRYDCIAKKPRAWPSTRKIAAILRSYRERDLCIWNKNMIVHVELTIRCMKFQVARSWPLWFESSLTCEKCTILQRSRLSLSLSLSFSFLSGFLFLKSDDSERHFRRDALRATSVLF